MRTSGKNGRVSNAEAAANQPASPIKLGILTSGGDAQGMNAAVNERVHGIPGDVLEMDQHLVGCCRRILSDALADLIDHVLCAG